MDHRIDRVFNEILRRNPKLAERMRVERPRARIAAALVRVRNALGYTQRDVAKLMKTDQPNIARLEKASGNPQTTDAIVAYAKACGLTVGLVFIQPHQGSFAIVEATAIDHDDRSDEFLRGYITAQAEVQEELPYAAAAAAAAVV